VGAQPTLTTPRLVLRPFTARDAPDVQRLAGDRSVAATTVNIPHPYPDGAAEVFIASQEDAFAAGTGATFAVTDKATGDLLGGVGITITARFRHAELGYWIAADRWGRGYATEAAAELLRYAFEDLGLHRVYARYFPRNPQSGRVMRKLGMTPEGRLRGHVFKDGAFEDLEVCGILAEEWLARRREG
jgi:RimJ/RimL family protein N-acetyltransferase